MHMAPRIPTVLFAILLLASCGGEPAAPTAQQPPQLDTLVVAAGDSGGGLAWDGVVQAVEQSVLSAQTGGRVAQLAADVGQRVAQGEVLLRLTSEEQAAATGTARAQLRAAEAQASEAAVRFDRANELVGRQLISRDEFDRVRAARDAAAANRDAAAAQLAQSTQQLGYTVVRAPYAGVVAARHVEQGETIAPGQSLFVMYAPTHLRLEVQLPQSDAEAVRRNAAATVVLADGRELKPAKVTVHPSSDALAHSTTVRLLLPSITDPPRPGQTVKVRFAAAAGPAGTWLPATAVVSRGELTGAYVVDAEGVVLRQLRAGRALGGRIEILAGLAPGERVAADPVAALAWLRARHDGSGAGS
jgi:RND family efflux transporter MFP subunit